MARTPYPANVKDSSGNSDSVQPVALIGFYGDDANVQPIPVQVVGGDDGSNFVGLTDEELRAAPVPVSGPLTNAQLRATPLDLDPADVQAGLEAGLRCSTGVASSVDSVIAGVTLLAANPARKGATIYNTDTNLMYVLLSGAGEASSTNFTTIVTANGGYYELPYGYSGRVRAIWAGDGAGAAKITEFV